MVTARIKMVVVLVARYADRGRLVLGAEAGGVYFMRADILLGLK